MHYWESATLIEGYYDMPEVITDQAFAWSTELAGRASC